LAIDQLQIPHGQHVALVAAQVVAKQVFENLEFLKIGNAVSEIWK